MRHDTIKPLEEKIRSTLCDVSLSNIFWICLLRQGKQNPKKPNGTSSNLKLLHGEGNYPQNENHFIIEK